jgi:hypothetical protein
MSHGERCYLAALIVAILAVLTLFVVESWEPPTITDEIQMSRPR